MKLILASTSPRRLDLLAQLGIKPDAVVSPSCDETPHKAELPRLLALRLALAKAQSVQDAHAGKLILAADTVVACGRRILPKCETGDDVCACLKLLSGRRHRVYGGLCLIDAAGRTHTRLSESTVTFKRLTREECDAYIASGEGIGKAGGYALQGKAASLIRFVSGSPSNVIGLDLFAVTQMLKGAGYGVGSAL